MDGVARVEEQAQPQSRGWRPCRGSAFFPCLPKAQEQQASSSAADKPQPLRVLVRKPVSFSFVDYLCLCEIFGGFDVLCDKNKCVWWSWLICFLFL